MGAAPMLPLLVAPKGYSVNSRMIPEKREHFFVTSQLLLVISSKIHFTDIDRQTGFRQTVQVSVIGRGVAILKAVALFPYPIDEAFFFQDVYDQSGVCQ